MQQGDERRDATRVPVEAEVSLEFPDIDELFKECSTNVSLGGMFIMSSNPRPVGTTVRFALDLPGEVRVIAGSAEVMWVRRREDAGLDSPPGMGVRFVELDGVSRAIIFRIVDRFIQEEGGEPFDINQGDTAGSEADDEIEVIEFE
ncbi:MAG: TIGR02266 family protein [bacterium]|nr:TIGR02266 family protein [bacterium]